MGAPNTSLSHMHSVAKRLKVWEREASEAGVGDEQTEAVACWQAECVGNLKHCLPIYELDSKPAAKRRNKNQSGVESRASS
jgi:hypothetical protein